MKLPRDVTGRRLAAVLERLGYRVIRQRGSHIHLVTAKFGRHHIVVPDHQPLKPGTLSGILKFVAEHHGLTRDELIDMLEL